MITEMKTYILDESATSGIENRNPEYRRDETSQTIIERYSIQNYIESSTTKTLSTINTNLAREDICTALNYLHSDLYDELGKDEFTQMLETILIENGNLVVNILFSMIDQNQIKGIALTQVLKSIGDVKHVESHSDRLLLLERFLFHKLPRIRDGASLGLSLLNDSHAIRYLEMAISCEDIDELKVNFQKVVQQLEQ
jgi:hypothetical protein